MGEKSLAAAYDRLLADLTGGTCPTCGAEAIRVGTDVQGIAEVEAALARHGERYVERLLLPEEVRDCLAGAEEWGPGAIASLAARYAAKEAAIKVLRPVQTGVPWTDVRVVRDPAGWCTMELRGRAASLARDHGLVDWALSFAHDSGVAVATVVGTHGCGAPPGGPA